MKYRLFVLALLAAGCAQPPAPAPPPVALAPASALPTPAAPRPRILYSPPQGEEPPHILVWRERYAAWQRGDLDDYFFEPVGVAPAYDPTPLGKRNARGKVVTSPPVLLPERSSHESEPWGDPGCVWPIRERWSQEWERRFSLWMSADVDAKFLFDADVAVDCADAPYAFRWIFARMHSLPQGAHNVDGAVFGNWNTRFAELPTHEDWRRDERFRAALDYVLQTYVQGRSLLYDTYPINIMPHAGALRPGTVIADRRHERIVHRIEPDTYRPIRHLSATLPSKVRVLADETLSAATANDGVGWGIVNWSWWDYDFNLRRYRVVPDDKMPGFSVMQYPLWDEEINAGYVHKVYQGAVIEAHRADPQTVMDEMIEDLRQALFVRRLAVDEGFEFYSARPEDRDSTTREYDDFSTPGRDSRLLKKYRDLELEARFNGLSQSDVAARLETVTFEFADDASMTLHEFGDRLLAGKVSSEPWDPLWKRWGLDPPANSTNSLE